MTAAPRSKLVKRFWRAAVALLTLLVSLVIGNFCVPASKRVTANMVGHDFLAFYTAGTFVREGRTHDLYQLEKVKTFQHDLARREGIEVGESFGPFWNPPLYAWVFVPLSGLTYHKALLAWEAVNLCCLVAGIVLLVRLVHSPTISRRHTALIPILIVTSMPLVMALTHGQNTMTSLLLLTLTATFWRAGRPVLAGLAAGLLLYKPQLAVVVAVALTLTMGWRAALTIALCGLALLLATILTLPGAIHDYQAFMPGNLRRFQVEQVYLWHRHATFRAFWRLLLQGTDAGPMSPLTIACWLASTTALAAGLAWAWLQRRRQALIDPTPLIAAAVAAMPLLMPFYFDYDLLLVSVAAVCYVATRQASDQPHPADRYLTPAWCALYLWQMVNVAVGGLTHVNGTVILLTAVAGLLTWRAARPALVVKTTPAATLDFGVPSLATNA